MHLKWPSGHSRAKQGLQGSSSFMTSARGDNGGVNDGLLDPYSASMGRSSAAAMCISPESLDTTTCAADSRSTASSRLGGPAQVAAAPAAQLLDLLRRWRGPSTSRSARPASRARPVARRGWRSARAASAWPDRTPHPGTDTRPAARCAGRGARSSASRCARETRQGRLRQRALQRLVLGIGEVSEALGHQRQRARVEPARVVEQNLARFADEAGAQPDARQARDQRGLERVRQHDGLIVAARLELAARAASAAPASARRARTGSRSPRSTSGMRSSSGSVQAGASTSSSSSAMLLVQALEQRLRQHGVADPRRADYQDLVHLQT